MKNFWNIYRRHLKFNLFITFDALFSVYCVWMFMAPFLPKLFVSIILASFCYSIIIYHDKLE